MANESASPRYPDALKPGEQIGEYVIQDVLGSGGFGITYGAVEKGRARKRYAVKEFFVREVCSREGNEVVLFGNVKQEDRDNYKKALNKFEEEAEILSDLSHRSIVRSLGFFEANNTAYIVMEFVRGRDLGAWLASRTSPLRERQVKDIFERVLDAVKYIHDRDFMHRDLSPENIMITRRNDNDVPVVIDFGTMGEGLDRIRSRSLLAYRPEYSPPEQTIHRTKQGAFTDIFALGGILYRTIAGRPPADPQGRYLAMVNDEPDPYVPAAEAATDASLYSADFLEGIDAALRIMPQDRPQNIAEFRALLGWSTSRAKAKAAREAQRESGETARREGKTTKKAPPRTEKVERPQDEDAAPPSEPPPDQPPGPRPGPSPMAVVGGLVALAMILGAAYLFVIKPQDRRADGGGGTARTARNFVNIHFAGREIGTTSQSSAGNCETACMGNNRCAAFSFSASSGQCTAFSSVNQVNRDNAAVSGVDRANRSELSSVERRIDALEAEEKRAREREKDRKDGEPKPRTAETFSGYHFSGGVISTSRQSSSGSCEAACMGNSRCVAFSYSGRQCTAYSSVTNVRSDSAAISGVDRDKDSELAFVRRRISKLIEEEAGRKDEERRRELERERELERQREEARRREEERRRQEEEDRRRREEEERQRQQQNKPRIAEYVNVDFFGEDVDSPPGRATSNATECARACLGHGSCRAFTYNQNKRAGTRNCFLKSGSGIPTETAGSVSYLRYRGSRDNPPRLQLEFDIKYNVDYPFNDLHQNIIRTSGIEQCSSACSTRNDCAGFSFVRNSNQCWLKRSTPNARRKSGVTSGVKRSARTLTPNRIIDQ